MAEYLRAAWGAQPAKKPLTPLRDVPNGVLHHIGGGNAYPINVVSTLQQIQAMEQHSDYIDIAYNWGVDKDGNLWELRGDVQDGATLGYAGSSFSVLAICNASASDFRATPQLIAGIAACFRKAQTRGVLSTAPHIDGHHVFDMTQTRYPTACPGVLEADIPQIRTLVANQPPAPAPAPPKVAPMYNPPVTVPSVVASLDAPGGGAWTLSIDGSVRAWGTAPYKGGANGQPYWGTRTASRLEAHGAGYTIIASTGERYDFP